MDKSAAPKLARTYLLSITFPVLTNSVEKVMDKSAARGGWPGQLACSSLTVSYIVIHKEIKNLTPTERACQKVMDGGASVTRDGKPVARDEPLLPGRLIPLRPAQRSLLDRYW